MKYDNFPPFQALQSSHTEFSASRYETWMEGTMIDGGECKTVINISPSRKSNNQETNTVSLNWAKGKAAIAQKFVFDVGFSQNDRLTYATILKESSTDCVGIIAIRNVTGITNNAVSSEKNVPYCGNMFLKYGVLVKLAFAFSNPEKLIEFYSSEAEDQIFSVLTAKCTLELLIEDFDSDGAYVGFEAIQSLVKETYEVDIAAKHFKQAEIMLNSGVGGYTNMVTTGYTRMYTSYFKSNYGKGPMRAVLAVINNDMN